MNTITYKNSFGQTGEIPLGQDYQLKRQDGDIILARDVAHDLPVKVAIQITADGQWRWWYSEASRGRGNPYWHFSNMPTRALSDEIILPPCTDAQRETLEKMASGELSIFGMSGALGMPVIAWVFGEETAQEALGYHS